MIGNQYSYQKDIALLWKWMSPIHQHLNIWNWKCRQPMRWKQLSFLSDSASRKTGLIFWNSLKSRVTILRNSFKKDRGTFGGKPVNISLKSSFLGQIRFEFYIFRMNRQSPPIKISLTDALLSENHFSYRENWYENTEICFSSSFEFDSYF